ncbi:hypothetical protein DM47_1094 [Burkholderia mallei]|nr:hypothetical protein DM46_535 [Burkholderia mallei]KOT17870.1 hypothetical protein DM47_1094 [Burkholderia mallei]
MGRCELALISRAACAKRTARAARDSPHAGGGAGAPAEPGRRAHAWPSSAAIVSGDGNS